MRNRLAQSCSPVRQWVGNICKHPNPAPVLLPVLALIQRAGAGESEGKDCFLPEFYLTNHQKQSNGSSLTHSSVYHVGVKVLMYCISPFPCALCSSALLGMRVDSLSSLPSCPTSRFSPSWSTALTNSPETLPLSPVSAPRWTDAEQTESRKTVDK